MSVKFGERHRWRIVDVYLWVCLDDGQPPRPVRLLRVCPEEVVDFLVGLLLCLRCGSGAVQPDLVALNLAAGLAPLCAGARRCGGRVRHCVCW